MGVGLRIKLILREKKMTIKELANISGVPVNTLYSITKRDSCNVNSLILSDIAKTLELSENFFYAKPPFDNLDFLEDYKAVILENLEKNGGFSWNGRSVVDVGNYEFWKVISDNILSIKANSNGDLDIQYNDQAEHTEKVATYGVTMSVDTWAIWEPIIKDQNEIWAYMVLRQLGFMNRSGILEVLKFTEQIAQDPLYKK